MPFSPLSNLVFAAVISPLAQGAGYRVERADTTLNLRAIMQDVVRGLQEAALVIADLTGRNANVFYELGLAHVMDRPTLLLAQSTNDIPFDLKAYRTVIYSVEFGDSSTIETGSEAELSSILGAAIKGELVFSNPYKDYSAEVPSAPDAEAPTEGVLDAMARFISEDAPAATDALARLTTEMERSTAEQEAALAAHQIEDDPNPLQTALALAHDLAQVWTESSDRLESLVDDDLVPAILGIEKDVASVLRGAAANPDADINDFLVSLAGLADVTTEFVATVGRTATLIRANSTWASSLLGPGARLAALYERVVANVERIQAMAISAAEGLGSSEPS
jgi:hypothetical protein